MKLPVLYKRTAKGALEQWSIWTEPGDTNPQTSTIVTEHGLVGGKLQQSRDTIREGKNLGKANATTAEQQAEKEVLAEWTKKRERRGYVEDPERAQAGETDQAGGVPPMLALEHKKAKHKLRFPCIIQRKYNGIRCIAVYDPKTGKVTLWTRKCERITSMPHVVAALEKLLADRTEPIALDGELYLHGMRLQDIASYVRQKTKPKEGHERIQYHIYDLPLHPGTNELRDFQRMNLLMGAGHPLVWAPSGLVHDLESADKLHDEWVQEGYEGAILRNLNGLYRAGYRSPDLQKYKKFDTGEFLIIGVKEGRGKFEGLAIFECRTPEGAEFDCCAPGTLEERAEYFDQKYVGKKLTIKFFGWTQEGKPFHPVPEAVRDYE